MLHLITTSPRDAETIAIDRDLRDAERLEHLDALILEWLDALIPDAHPLENPSMRWQPGDLIDELQRHLCDIRTERLRLNGPLVVD